MDLTKIIEIKKNDHSYNTRRLISQFEFALNFAKTKADDLLKNLIEQEMIRFLTYYENDGSISNRDLAKIEEHLKALSEPIKALKIHCLGHAHIDMNWMWGYDETVEVTLNTFRTVLRLMDKYPEFTFSQSQASIYEIVEKYDPEMLTQIKQKIKEGRWEVTASFWTESDKNMPSTESLIRHLIYTKNYLSDLLDIDADSIQLDFEPDTFGHPLNLPEILNQGGIKYYYFCRGKQSEGMFNWQSPSGKQVLVYQEPIWYNAEINPYDFAFFPEFMSKNKLSSALKVYGVGDHGGGPTEADILSLIDMSTWPLMPNIVFSTYQAFFQEAEKTEHPIYSHEINPIFEGCYTSQAYIKSKNKEAERLLYLTELLSLVKNRNDDKNTARAWKDVLFNQFHDILTGSGTYETRNYAMGKYQEALASCKSEIVVALNDLSEELELPEHFKDSNLNYLILNPLTSSNKALVDIKLWDLKFDIHNLLILDSSGNELEYVVKDPNPIFYWSHFYQTISVLVEMEALEYQLLNISEKAHNEFVFNNPNPVEQTMRIHSVDEFSIENEMFKVLFNESGSLVKIINKADDTDFAALSDPVGLLRLINEDATKGMTAWNIGRYLSVKPLNQDITIRNDLIVKNKLYQQFGYELLINNSKVEVIYRLNQASKAIEIDINLDWQEIGSVAKGVPALEYSLTHNAYMLYQSDSHLSLIKREQLNNDIIANNFLLAQNKNSGIAFVNRDNYGYRVDEAGVSLKLIRSSIDPDKYPEIGRHEFHLALILLDDLAEVSVFAEVNKFLYNNLVYRKMLTKGKSAAKDKLFSVIEGNCQIASIKKLKDKLTLRLLETSAKKQDVVLEFKGIKEAYESDIFGNKLSDINVSENQVRVTLEESTIKTITVVL